MNFDYMDRDGLIEEIMSLRKELAEPRESVSLDELLSDERLRPLVMAVKRERDKSPYVWFNIPDELRAAIDAVK